MLSLAVDYEAEYSDTLSIKTMGTYNYTRTTDIYLVSIARSDGSKFVGHPKDFDWESVIEGHQFCSHNATFDSECFRALIEKGIIPNVWPEHGWNCTADLSAYLGYPRSLAVASGTLLGVDVSKDTRNKMKGKKWDDMTPEFQEEMRQYAMRDAELCLELWQKFSHRWPEHERQLSRHTARMAAYGVAVDRDYLLEGKALMEAALGECRGDIPWGEPLLSKPQFDAACSALGIPAPKSLAKTSEEFAEWLEKYGEEHKFARAVSRYRKVNTMLSRIEAMLARCRWVDDHWRMDYSLMYYGALTGRFSGGGGSLNMQNLRRDEIEGFEVRKAIVAPPGKKLIVSDLANIEPRCFLAGTLVKTTRGYIPIEDLRQVDKIWDGAGFVAYEARKHTTSHRKGICKVNGEYCTKDHRIYTSDSTNTCAEKTSSTEAWICANLSWGDVWKVVCAVGRILGASTSKKIGLPLSWLRSNKECGRGVSQRGIPRLSCSNAPSTRKNPVIKLPSYYMGVAEYLFQSSNALLKRLVVGSCLILRDRVYRQRIFNDSSGIVDTYDLVNCGKWHRFATAGCIASNCGAEITKDTVFLEKLRGSGDIYEAYARAAMRYTDPMPLKEYDKVNKTNLRQLSKAVVLGCAYGAGGVKFKSIAKTMAGLELTETEAQSLVEEFRASNPKITRTWRMLDNALKRAVGKPRFEIELPSGRVIPHFEPKAGADRNVSVLVSRLGKFMRVKLWGSNAYETVIQGAARDVFAEGVLRVEDLPGCRVVAHTHDEVIAEAEEHVSVSAVEAAMCIPPAWAPTLPLAAEGHEMQRYSK